MQGTWVQSLVQEDSICHGATKPMLYNYQSPKKVSVRQMLYDITYMWNLNMTQINISTKQKQTQTWRTDVWLPTGRGRGRGKEWELGISRCKLVYMTWINNQVLMYSTGNLYSISCDKP